MILAYLLLAAPIQQPAAVAESPRGGDMIIINPIDRAHDIAAAFKFFKDTKATLKLTITLADQTESKNILDVHVLPGGTLIVFKMSTPMGEQYQIVATETISHIGIES